MVTPEDAATSRDGARGLDRTRRRLRRQQDEQRPHARVARRSIRAASRNRACVRVAEHVDGVVDGRGVAAAPPAGRRRSPSRATRGALPSRSQASVAMTAGPPAFVRMATPGPCGTGWRANASASPKRSSMSRGPDDAGGAEGGVVGGVRPGERTGVRRDGARARVGSAGLEQDHRACAGDLRRPPTRSVARRRSTRGSRRRPWSPDRRRTPRADRTPRRPRGCRARRTRTARALRLSAQSRTAVPSAPDCDRTAIVPGGGIVTANEALRCACGAMRPRQFGPEQPDAVPRGALDHVALERRAGRTGLLEAGGDDDHRAARRARRTGRRPDAPRPPGWR